MLRKNKQIIVEPGCNRNTEEVVDYYVYAAWRLGRRFGLAPSRATLWAYIKRGYPVYRFGPYVKMPHFRIFRSVKTTKEAVERFLETIKVTERVLLRPNGKINQSGPYHFKPPA